MKMWPPCICFILADPDYEDGVPYSFDEKIAPCPPEHAFRTPSFCETFCRSKGAGYFWEIGGLAVADLSLNHRGGARLSTTCPMCRLVRRCLETMYGVPSSATVLVGFDYTMNDWMRWRLRCITPNSAVCRQDSVSTVRLVFPTSEKVPNNAVEADPMAPSVLEFMRSRIEDCCSQHQDCETRLAVNLPPRLVDTGPLECHPDVKLIEPVAGKMGSYAALSHCWGGSQPLRTTNANLTVHLAAGIPWQCLPRNFQDVVRVTRALGQRYLWIDSLCIVQDDEKDWERNAGLMATIYQHAHFTIVASASANPDAGFLHQRQRAVFTFEDETAIGYGALMMRNPWRDGDHRDDSKRTFPLDRRGWAYQERMMSTRTLSFRNHISFECRAEITCECGVDPLVPRLGPRRELWWSERSPLRKNQFQSHPINQWMNMVAEYSARQFTYETDRLPAISSLERFADPMGKDLYLHGLWMSKMPQHLAWCPAENRIPRPPELFRIPSWSWASRAGMVLYPERNPE
ncbi:heterokaryon incompatibility protein-domain-containing protein, partial [Echria macrotheca]